MSDCPLSRGEYRALLLTARGLSSQQAACKLGLTDSTVRSHLHQAYTRLGVGGIGQALALMYREHWLFPEQSLRDYTGDPYARRATPGLGDKAWLPSPAQRLYLDAFDVLMDRRTREAADLVDFYFGVMCRERRISDRRRGGEDVDSMLLGMARALRRPIPVAA